MRTLAAFIFATFCACTGQVQYSATATATAEGPDLVEVSPGVQVVADYDESVFYADGAYWRSDGAGWYRSDNYAGGYVYIDAPPVTVTRISNPRAFTHYRPSGYVARHRTYRRPEPVRREHREERREDRREDHDGHGPVVRDHREH